MNDATGMAHAISEDTGLPYSGIRVLDLSQGIAGPSAAGILARQGAEVIKIEPFAGDWGRLMGGGREGITAISVSSNLGKKSVCIDASTPEGADLILRMAREADILVESFRPGVMERLGLGYETIAAQNPRILFLSISGFGQDGPAKDLPGADTVLQAISGMMVMNRDAEGTPRRVGMQLIDAAAGVYAAQSIGAALFARERSGRGKRIDISLLAASAALQSIPILDDFIHAGKTRPPVTVPSGTFKTRDGLLNLTSLRDKMFFGLARAIGHPEWESDPAYANNQLRLARSMEINALIQGALLREDTAYWIEQFGKEDVLCAPVLDYGGLRAYPQAIHQHIFQEMHQPGMGDVPIAAIPGLDAGSEIEAAPYLGEHTHEVLRALGLGADEIARLEEQRIVLAHRCTR